MNSLQLLHDLYSLEIFETKLCSESDNKAIGYSYERWFHGGITFVKKNEKFGISIFFKR